MTIRHIVLFKLASDDPQIRAAHVREATERLMSLQGVVPTLKDIQVGADVLHGANSWDLALIAHFDNLEGLEQYIVNEDHQAVVEFLSPIVSARAAADLEI